MNEKAEDTASHGVLLTEGRRSIFIIEKWKKFIRHTPTKRKQTKVEET